MKLFYSIIISLLSVAGYSQTILHQTENTTRTVQDPQTVIMAPGFKATSGVSNPFIAKIGPGTENPGGGPADSQAGANNPSGTSAPQGVSFHDTKGEIDVNGGGQLQFTLPIALPPGVKSVAPKVDLVYTSGAGNGIAGYGWNISGITAVSRVGRNIERDGKVQGIQLDYSDHFIFGGQRLILKSGEYGRDGAEYVTEKYSNLKIKSYGSKTGIQGPMMFHIIFEDGSQAWYGDTEYEDPEHYNTGRTSVDYNIVKWMDPQGNYITYEYLKSQMPTINPALGGDVAVIKKISWGGNEKLNKPHFNEIIFNYSTDRTFKETSYLNGFYYLQDKLLQDITVKTNGTQFKRYAVDYNNNGTKYNFVKNITEYNSANEPANPILFENEQDPEVATNLFRQDNRFDDIRSSAFSGDFNGDGKLDFINGNKLMLSRLDGNGNFINISYQGTPLAVGTYASPTTPINNQVLITGLIDRTLQKCTIYFYKFQNNNFVNIASNEINLTAYSYLFSGTDPSTNPRCNLDGDYHLSLGAKEVDFNGDGLSELILLIKNEQRWLCDDYWGSGQTYYETTTNAEINLYVDFFNNIVKPIDESTNHFISYTYAQNIDLDGDGITELLDQQVATLRFFSFDINTGKFSKKYNDVFLGGSGLNTPRPIVGDFNGDGKTDIFVATAENSLDWKMYLSTGKQFIEYYYSNFFLYEPKHEGKPRKRRVTLRTYTSPDLNKDSKSDFLVFQSEVWFRDCATCVNNPDSSYGFTYFRNDGVDASGKPIFTQSYHLATKEATSWGDNNSEDINYSMYGEHYIPMFGNYRIAQLNNAFVIIHKTKLITWDLGAKLNKISRVKSITQGGLKTDIEYSDMTSEGNIYKSYVSSNPVLYPYTNTLENYNSFLVSRIIQGSRKQDFRYRDLIGHLQGKGIVGFRQLAKSTFYVDGAENTKIWNGSEISPLSDALPYKEWTIRTVNENLVFPNDISINNTQLLSFKQFSFKTDKLLNGNIVSSFSLNEKPKIVDAIVPTISIAKDFLKNIKTVHNVVQYNSLYLPEKSTTNVNDGYSVTTMDLEYFPPNTVLGSDYSIGKPKTKLTTINAYGDTKSLKEEYTYEATLLKTLKTWNDNNSGYLLENYNYDGFGNITEKIISNSIDSQTNNEFYDYDSKGRFVVKKKDNLGLETNISYNNWGQILTEEYPSSTGKVNIYDAWGKILSTKYTLQGETKYFYEKDNLFNTVIIQYDPDGNISKKYNNKLGQNYKNSSKAFAQGKYINREIFYDLLGRKVNESEPYYEGQSAAQWNSITYDDSVFPAKITSTSANGRQTEITIQGNTTTEKELNGYNRTTSKTTDALGNIISSTDKGGTITFSFNAANEQIKAQYGDNIVTTKYDVWGRKSEFNDPSNGLYKYEYFGFGNLKKVISPKGVKEYEYNSFGQLKKQREFSTVDQGQTTAKSMTFIYDEKGRLISKSGTSNGVSFSSNQVYDTIGRLLSSSESGNGKYFIHKGISYDDKMRVIAYEKQLYSSGILTKVQIENIYSPWNGELHQIKDKQSGKILWEINETNEKRLITKSKLGAAEINNIYDSNGFLTNINHSSSVKPSLLQISYSFNAIKNELNSKTTGGDFNIIETFDYDDNNRLINWTNPVTGIKPSLNRNVYDAKGRITQNDQVGNIKFENSAKIYQPTGMTLNSEGLQNYNNDLIQNIVFNENNDPVFIDGEIGDVGFQYGLTSMRQKVTYGGNFNTDGEGKFTKLYSSDGSFEILKDNNSGKEKHIIYIGGNPYDSNILYLKNFEESMGSYRFLHKDYLGSILAISDELGNKLEQRHFDAWGNFTHLQIGKNSILTDKNVINNSLLLVDRGYTSHEHFGEVGIIHMNGRLYDPLLRRFLNADENIQDPYNTQNYNKYGYVMNNPLMYNDPSGEFIWWVPAAIAAVAVGVKSYFLNEPITYGSVIQSLSMSYISAGLTGGIGTIFQAGGTIATALGTTGTIIAKAAAHAIAGGAMSAAQGGKFWSGALSGAFSSVSNDLLDIGTVNVPRDNILRSDGFALFNGAVSGGVGSVIAGGNFWMGAVQGLIVTTFNYLAHKPQESILKNQMKGKYELNAKPDFTDEGITKMIDTIPELKRLYELGGKTAVIKVVEYIIDKNAKGEFVILNDYGITNTNLIRIASRFNLTNWELAITLGHELIHVYHNMVIKSYIESFVPGPSASRWRGRVDISEVEAYTWENEMGNTEHAKFGLEKHLPAVRAKIPNYRPKKLY